MLFLNRTVGISNSASPEIIWGLGGPEEDQLHHCCWTGRVGEREEEGAVSDNNCVHYYAIVKYHFYIIFYKKFSASL